MNVEDRPSVGRLVAAAVFAAAMPATFAHAVLGPVQIVAIATILIAAQVGGARVLDEDRWLLRWTVWAGAGIAVALLGLGEAHGVWAAACLCLADWSALQRRPLPAIPARGQPIPGVAVLTALGTIDIVRTPYGWDHMRYTAAGFAVTALAAWLGDSLARGIATAARAIAGALAFVLFAILGLFTVVLPWIGHRIFRLDPVAVAGGQGWIDRPRLDVDPGRPGSRSAPVARGSAFRRARWRVAVPLTVLGVAIVVVAFVLGDRRTPAVTTPLSTTPAAVGAVDWWPAYMDELEWAFGGVGGATNLTDGPPLHDVRGRFINVESARRVTWRPPACGCRRLEVWFYGGSTVLGWGQRDDFTLPSQLARVAWEDGIALDISNRGVPGDLNWYAVQRFGWDVAKEPKPDLVLFYDGSNDLRAAYDRNADRDVGYDPTWPIDWNVDATGERLTGFLRSIGLMGRPPQGATRVEPPVGTEMSMEDLGLAVARNYDAGRLPALAIEEREGVPIEWYWQPDLFTKRPVPGEPRPDADADRRHRAQRAAAVAALPDDVHDISGDFDDVREPMFFDDVHTGERGARLIAERMYSDLLPTLRSLDDAG